MSCPLNKKKHWRWAQVLFALEDEGEHEYTYHNIKKQDNLWICTTHCKFCKEWQWRTFTHSEMIRLGIIDKNGNISIPELQDFKSNSKVFQLFNDKDFTKFLKNIHKQRLIIKSNNRSKQDKAIATNEYNVFIEEFTKSKDVNIKLFKELLNIFIKDENNYTEENINKVLDILFYNQYLNYLDSVNVTPNFIKNTITKFINNSNNNNDKYAATKKAIEQFDEVQSEIADISLPSLNFKESNSEKESLKDSVGKLEIDGKKELVLFVYKDGKKVKEDTEYSVNADGLRIDIIGALWGIGVVVDFTIVKGIVNSVIYQDGGMITNGTITETKLTTALQNKVNLIVEDVNVPGEMYKLKVANGVLVLENLT